MNVRRKFLIASVLSIQDPGFTYPACQNCFSRLIRSSNRYECLKCGFTSKDATHRYKLCVKVAEDNELYIITVFGSCLDKIFGICADSLQRHIQDSVQAPGNLPSERLQDLLFQAVELCFIGRSFLFGVKIPINHPEDSSTSSVSLYGTSRHMVACQIMLPNDDPIGFTVFHNYNRLLQSHLDGTQLNHRICCTPSDKCNLEERDICTSDSSYDCHPSGNKHFLDFWHQSFSLTSSSSFHTSRESAAWEFSKDQSTFVEVSEGEEEFNSLSNSVSQPRPDFFNNCSIQVNTKEELQVTKVARTSLLVSHNTNDSNPLQNTSSFQDNCSNSKIHCRQEMYLHKPWSLLNCTSQLSFLCSPDLPSKNVRTAGTHHDDVETWEDFLFSESLSDFLARVEHNEGTESPLCFPTYKRYSNAVIARPDGGLSRTSTQLIKTPFDVIAQYTTRILKRRSETTITDRETADGNFEPQTVYDNDAFDLIPRLSCKLQKRAKSISSALLSKFPIQSYVKPFHEISPNTTLSTFPANKLGSPSIQATSIYEISRTSPNLTLNTSVFCLQTNYNSVLLHNQEKDQMLYRLSQHFYTNSENTIMANRSSIVPLKEDHFDLQRTAVENSLESESFIEELDEPNSLECPWKFSCVSSNGYNGSADLFDTDETMHETKAKLLVLSNKVNMKRRFSEQTDDPSITLTENSSPSPTLLMLNDNYHFIPYSQSTPVAKQLTRTRRFGMINKSANGRLSIVYPRNSSGLLKTCLKGTCSLLEKTPNIFCSPITDFQISKSPVLERCITISNECRSRLSLSPLLPISDRQRFENKQMTIPFCITTGNNCFLENKENCQPDEEKMDTVCNSNDMDVNKMDTILNTLDDNGNLSTKAYVPLPSEQEVSAIGITDNLPSEWSPELFSEKSAVSQCNSLQRRLF
ncbi:DNA damage-induced apoptosis suppressor protein [Discoglossus pictus]